MINDHSLPPQFVQNVSGLGGSAWLESLPTVVGQVAAHWSLTLLSPFSLSYNYVAPATTSNGRQVVLKIGLNPQEWASEMTALQIGSGSGMIRLIDALPEQNAMLLERVLPGTPLAERFLSGEDEEVTAIAAEVMTRICSPVPAGDTAKRFPTASDWGAGMVKLRERFHGGTGPLPVALVEEAESLWRDLLTSSALPALIHGDIHHGNMLLSSDGSYIAIDPKGLIAEPAYEVGALLRNPSPYIATHPDARRITERRIAILSERAGFSKERIRAWGIAQAVLSAWWSIEDSGEKAIEDIDDFGQDALLCAEHIAAVKV